jgi:aminobenzoyl-glutamate utilization protein B
MTETQVATRVVSGVSNLIGNRPLEQAMQRALDALGPVPFDDADRAFARAIRATLTDEDIAATFRRIGMEPDFDKPLCDFIAPLDRRGQGGEGSTDVGDVSWAVPTVQARVATCAIGTPFHTWQVTAQGKSAMAHKGMIHAAKVMAATARLLIEDPATLAAAQEAHRRHLARTPYVCPIPDDVHPPVAAAAA